MSEPRALITGGTGFVGSRLAQRLLDEGWHVHLLTRAGSKLDALGASRGHVRITRISDPDSAAATASAVEAAMDAADPDVVFSLATLRQRSTLEQVAQLVDATVRLPTLLVAALAERGGGRIITTASYQHASGLVAPTIFSAARGGIDPILEWAGTHTGVRCATLSLTSVYGPDDQRGKLLPALLDAARSESPIGLVAPDRVLDLVHVDDVARAYVRAAQLIREDVIGSGERYDVSSGERVTLRELVAAVEQAAGRPIDARWNARAASASDEVDPPSKPSWVPGWTPRMALTDGLRDIARRSAG